MATSLSAHAASSTWTGTSTIDGNWSDASNWNGGVVPGSVSATNSTDTATFSGSIANGWGTTTTPILIDSSSQNIGSLAFSGNGVSVAADSYTIGAATGATSTNALYLSSGGAISVNFASGTNEGNLTYVDTINSPLVLEGSYTFANNSSNSGSSTTSAGTLIIAGPVSAASSLGAVTLSLNGSNTTGNSINGNISDGSGNTLSLAKSGVGTWNLSGSNSYSGTTTITAGTVNVSNANSLSTGGVFLGDTTGTFSSRLSGSAGVTLANNITVQGGNTGVTTLGSSSATAPTFSGTITLGSSVGGTPTGHALTIAPNTNDNITISGNIVDPAGLTSGAGVVTIAGGNQLATVKLTGSNSFSGGLVLNTGALQLSNNNAAGTGIITINQSSNSSLGTDRTHNITLANNMVWATGFYTYIASVNGNNTTTTLNGNDILSTTGVHTLTLSFNTVNLNGVISNGSSITNAGVGVVDGGLGGTLALTGSNTFDGGVTATESTSGETLTLKIGNLGSTTSASALGTGTLTLNRTNGTLRIDNSSGANGTLATNNAQVWNGDFTFLGTNSLNTGTGSVSLGNASGQAGLSRTVTVTTNTLEVDGVIFNGSETGTSTTGITKAGAGTLILGGANTYTGTTTVSAGVLQIGNGGTAGSLAAGSSANGIVDNASVVFNRTDSGLTISQNISGTGSVTQAGSGVTILTGSNSYSGATAVNAGVLRVNGSLGSSSAVTIRSGGALGGTGTVGGSVALNAGGGINLVDGTTGTLTLGSLVIGTGATTMSFDIGAGSSNNLDLISTGALTTSTGTTSISIGFVSGSPTLTDGTYALISGISLTSAEYSAFALANSTLGTYNLQLVDGGAAGLELLVSGGTSESTSYYFTGTLTDSFTSAGNYNDAASGGNTHTIAPSSTSNIFLNASPAANTPASLTGTATINSLTYLTNGGSLAGSGTLTLAAGAGTGITDSATGGTTESVNPQVALGASQAWTVSSSTNTLAVNGGVTGSSGQTLTLNGPGTYNFSSGNSSGGYATTVDSGAHLLVTNSSGSALGTGTLTVQQGASFGGYGRVTGLSSFALGSGGSGTTAVQVGSGGTNVTTNLVLEASGASTIAHTTLSFNINANAAGGSGTPALGSGLGASGSGNELVVGATPINFGSGVTFNLTLQGNQIIAPDTAFVLIAGSGGNGDGSLAGSQFSGSGLSTTTLANGQVEINGLSLQFSNDDGFYSSHSYLFLVNSGGVDDIEVEVVPEPGTWAMMLGGLAVLFLWQRRKARQS